MSEAPGAGARRKPRRFDPAPYERELQAIIEAIERAPRLDDRSLDRIVKRHPRDGRGLFAKSEILAGFRRFGSRLGTREADFAERLRTRPVRTLSGVTPVTVLSKPYPCPGRCVFCPNDVRMPKSYLSDEPGAQRAEDHGFDPYRQTWSRLDAYRQTGHPTDKVELIALGGTWSFYPEPYRVWFVTRCLEAMSDFGAGVDRRGEASAPPDAFARLPRRVDGRTAPAYNRIVADALRGALGGSLLHASERADWEALERAQRANESAASRCVGLSLETRPDEVDAAEVRSLRRLGATKVQLGIQSLSDRVLAANRRGCDVATARRAVRLLRGAGFKLQMHWMPNLLGSTPADDVSDFGRLFGDPGFCPDELKLYPCSLVESAELVRSFESGAWRPYTDEELLDVVTACLRRTPRYCRVSRVIRDFSSGDILAGSRVANLREVAERRLRDEGAVCVDVRAREVRGETVDPAALALRETRYASSLGEEVFLEFVTPDDRLAGFARLSLPRIPAVLPELDGSALLREVHVYGASLELGRRSGGRAQHAGLGRRLVERALALAVGHARLSVISSVGTRAWYRSQGFRDGALYQHRAT